jgi:hypothetical protein
MWRRKRRRDQGAGWDRRPVYNQEWERAKQCFRKLVLFLYVVVMFLGWCLYRL